MDKTITASVGRRGRNKPDDVKTVQRLLNGIKPFLGGPSPPLDDDGIAGSKTVKAIHAFQLHNFGWSGADGRVDPDGVTLILLNVWNRPSVTPAAPPPKPQPEPLSSDFRLWLRFKGQYFDSPTKAEQFIFTMIDITNNRRRHYLFESGVHGKITPPSFSGSGGDMVKLVPRQPTTISGFAGRATYWTRIRSESGKLVPKSTLSLFPNVWEVDSGITGINLDFDAHLLKPTPTNKGVGTGLIGRFRLL